MTLDSSVSLRSLSFAYGQRMVLNHISLELTKGQTYALMGKNGCGKTTIIRCIMGILQPDSGSVWLNGKNVRKMTSKEIGRTIAYVPQTANYSNPYQVADYLTFGRTPYLAYFAAPTETDYDITHKCAEKYLSKEILDKRIDQLSGGEWQLVNIVRALIQNTDIIIMDEPSASLDLSNQNLFLKAIKTLERTNKTILFSTHDPNHALALDCNAILMENGSILEQGKASDVICQKRVSQMYGDGIIVQMVLDKPVCLLNP